MQNAQSIGNGEFIFYYKEKQKLATELASHILTEQGGNTRVSVMQVNDLKTDKCYDGDNFDDYLIKVRELMPIDAKKGTFASLFNVEFS